MQPLSHEILAANAYRTLGLSASATQAQIDAAARRMRIWPDERRIPPTPWDALWLGAVNRTRGEIERALSTLNEPASRVEHRLFWYHASAPADEAETAPNATIRLALPNRHDGVLHALHAASVTDPGVTEPARWHRVVEGVRSLASPPEFAAWMSRIEETGDFEKRASTAEIKSAVDSLAGAVLAALVPHAHAALDRDDPEACADIAMILRDAGGGTSPALRLLLDRLEDALDRQCRDLDTELRDKLRTDRKFPDTWYPQNRQACQIAATMYARIVAVSLARFLALAEGDSDRLVRARSRCAQLLALLAMGWEWSGRFGKAEETQLVALGLAIGSAGEAGIRKDLERYSALAAKQPSLMEPEPKHQPTVVRRVPPPPPQKSSSPQKSGSRIGGVAVAMLAVAILRAITSISSTDTSPTPYQVPIGLPDGRILTRQEQHDKDIYKLLESDIRQRLGSALPAATAPSLPGEWLPSIVDQIKSLAPENLDPRFDLNSSPLVAPAPSRPKADPALINDPFGESSREQ
jgi:hypothetical protein